MGDHVFDQPLYPGFHSEDWWPNDGAVSVWSQEFPRIPSPHPHIKYSSGMILTPDRWHIMPQLADWDHFDIVALPEPWQVHEQARFYTDLFRRLADL
jgi:hypothetical protein